VELKVKNDKLTAHIRAESAEAFEALEKEISTLKASLKEAGLEMNLTLSFNGQEEKDRHFSRSDKHYGAGQIEESSRSGPEEPLPPGLTADRNRLLDRVV
jgi:flagellar hook-length control protein FliK